MKKSNCVRYIFMGLGLGLVFLILSCSPSVDQKYLTDTHTILFDEFMHEL